MFTRLRPRIASVRVSAAPPPPSSRCSFQYIHPRSRWNVPPLISSHFSTNSHDHPTVDLRSDTVTSPTRPMLECALSARTGDDVLSEDPTALELEDYTAELFGKERGLYVPSGTMGNLVAILAHFDGSRNVSEMIVGSSSHISIYEGGNASTLGSIHCRQIPEHETTAEIPLDAILDAYRDDSDDHYAATGLVCLENSHNIMGGVALPSSYIDEVGRLAREEMNGVPVHIDGARIFHAAISQNTTVKELCRGGDSVSVCLSKGLGAPVGTVLVGSKEMIRLAKRARKKCGGGMRQVGVIASMGMYALRHNVERLAEDHQRATRLKDELERNGFFIPRAGKVDTNLVFFGLPKGSVVKEHDFCAKLNAEYGVKVGGGYGKGGHIFRAALHMDVDDEGVDRAMEGLVNVCLGGK